MSFERLFDVGVAEKALRLTAVVYHELVRLHIAKRNTLHIVVMQPRHVGSCMILAERTWGEANRDEWDAKFDEIARSKAEMSWRTGKSSSWIQHCAPQLLSDHDTIFWGSDVLDDSLVSAASGDHPYFDEAIAGTVNLFIRALCKEKQATMAAEARANRGIYYDGSTTHRYE